MLRFISLKSFARVSSDNRSSIASLRGAAALLVLVTHIEQVFVAPIWTGLHAYTALLGQVSVMVFFVLSGFLIGKSATSKTASGKYSLKGYAEDRAWRILPPLLLAIALMLTLYVAAPWIFASGGRDFLPEQIYVMTPAFALHPRELLGALTFLNGFITSTPRVDGPLWSLSFEVWLYVISGCAIAMRRSVVMLTTLALAFLLLGFLNRNFALYSMVWGAGFLVCVTHNNGALLNGSIRQWLRAGCPLLFTAAGACAILHVLHFDGSNPAAMSWRYLVAFNVFFGLGFASFLGLWLDKKTPKSPFFERSADYSYTLYITHFPILLFVFGVTQTMLHSSAIALGLVSIASFVLIVTVSRTASRLVENRDAMRSVLRRVAESFRTA